MINPNIWFASLPFMAEIIVCGTARSRLDSIKCIVSCSILSDSVPKPCTRLIYLWLSILVAQSFEVIDVRMQWPVRPLTNIIFVLFSVDWDTRIHHPIAMRQRHLKFRFIRLADSHHHFQFFMDPLDD